MSLSEAGEQSVTITGCYKKSVNLMFTHANPMIRHVDDVVLAPAASDKTIKWSVRHLVDKAEASQPPNSRPEVRLPNKHT
jgi:hypothetical protein